MTTGEPRGVLRFQHWLRYNYPQLLTLLGSAAVGVGGIGGLLDEETWGWFVLVAASGVVLTIAGGVAGLYTAPSIASLIASEKFSRDRAHILITGIRSAFAGELAQVLRFVGRYEPGARASLYLHVDGRFHIVSRSSSDPNLRPFGRTSYPPSEGVIGRAWSDSEAVAVDLPKRRDLWNSQMERVYGIAAADAARIRMQSRSLVAIRIDHDGPAGARPLGVVVLESVKPTAIGSDQRDSIMGSAEWRMFSAAVIGGLDALQSASFSPATADALDQPAAIGGGMNESEASPPRRRRSRALRLTNVFSIVGAAVFLVGLTIALADPTRSPSGVGVVAGGTSILILGACVLSYVTIGIVKLFRAIRSAWVARS